MNYEVFESLGLSPNEARMYYFLVEHGESSVSVIAAGAGIHRRNAYDAVNRLIEKGLCFEICNKGESRFNAVDPDKLLEIVKEKEEKLTALLPELKRKFKSRKVTEEAYIYKGLEGQKNIWRDVLRIGETSYFIGAKAAWYDPRLEVSRVAFFKEANRLGIKFVQLFDYEVTKNHPGFPKHFSGDLNYRVLPKEYSTNSAIHIFGDHVVTYAGLSVGKMNESSVIFVLKSKDLAESYRVWFRYMWKKSNSSNHA